MIKRIYKDITVNKIMTVKELDESDIFFVIDMFYGNDEEKQETIQFADDIPWL
ncbi:hypothetical protein [Cytobacillus horneckiae]|uniref:hypothetical protein n=1 Tax=Cytobacillus horneckiae TaxID=549687 RepID=UPI003D19BB10